MASGSRHANMSVLLPQSLDVALFFGSLFLQLRLLAHWISERWVPMRTGNREGGWLGIGESMVTGKRRSLALNGNAQLDTPRKFFDIGFRGVHGMEQVVWVIGATFGLETAAWAQPSARLG